MEYKYIAYTQDKRLVRGRLSADNEEAASRILGYGGYQVVNLKVVVPFFGNKKLLASFNRVQPKEIIMFSRQLALLLEGGTDIVTALELIQHQVTTNTFRGVLKEVTSDLRGGSSLSSAMSKHPRVFSEIYHRTIAAGEQGGNLDVVLRQMADYLERAAVATKKIKSALTYPAMLAVVGVAVMVLLVTVILPAFTTLYDAFGAELPLTTRIVMGVSQFLIDYGLYLLIGVFVVFLLAFVYIRTPNGRYRWDKLMLTAPVIGRLNLLGELARSCRTISLLFKVGLPLPEIMTQAMRSTKNRVVARSLADVQQELIRGEGLSKPMAKNKIFLPLMVQMVGVGEETGNLDSTLTTVAQSYEVEADDRTSAAIALIQPALVVIVAVVVGFFAISLISAMYSIYGQVKF